MAIRKKRGGIMSVIRGLREDAEHESYQANYYQTLGQKDRAAGYFRRLKATFAKADAPELAAEDVRYELQKIAAKARKAAIVSARRSVSRARRERVMERRDGLQLKALSRKTQIGLSQS